VGAADRFDLLIEISEHAREQMDERGVDETEVIAAIRGGEPEPARSNRTMYRKNFQYEKTWRNRQYRIKQWRRLSLTSRTDWWW
jgi:Ni/Co efflux regulator RcnB